MIPYGVHQSGRREVIGLDVGEAETEAFLREFLRGLRTRGLVNTIHRPSGDQLFRLTFTCPPRHGQVVAVNADDHPARASCV